MAGNGSSAWQMKHGEFKIPALFFGLTVAAPSAIALDKAEILEMARSSVVVTFLENSCDLVPSPDVEEQARQKYLQISETCNIAGDSSWSEFTKEIDRVAVEYASLNVNLPNEEFCERLQNDFLSIGGTLVKKE